MLEAQLSKIANSTICPVAIIVRDGKVLLGHRHYTKNKWKDISVWTSPGGRSEGGESVEDTLRREVAEEIGVTDLDIVAYIGEVPGAKEGDSVPLFLCSIADDPQLMEPKKFSEWKWFALEEYVGGEPKNHINEESRVLVTEYLKKHGGI